MAPAAWLRRPALVLLGILTGTLGAVVHRHDTSVLGVDWPWGLALAVAATAVVAWASAGLVRVGAAWFGLGWTLAIVLQQTVSRGSYLVAGDLVGWSFLGLGLGAVALVVVRAPTLEG